MQAAVRDTSVILFQNMVLLLRAEIWLLVGLVGSAVKGIIGEGPAVEDRAVEGRAVLSCLQCSATLARPHGACQEGSQEVGRTECGLGAKGCYAQLVKVTCK